MVTAYSTGPEDVLHGVGSDNVRRRSTYFRRRMLRSGPMSGGDQKEDVGSATSAPVEPSSRSIIRRPSSLNASRRRLPWLDGKVSSDKQGHRKHRHVPGEFVSDDDDTSWSTISSNVQPSPTRPKSPNPPLNTHMPNNASSAYTPSMYSTGAVSGVSTGPPAESPRPYRSYEALVSSPEKPKVAFSETDNISHNTRRTDTSFESSATSTPRLQPPLTLKRVSPVPISNPRESTEESEKPLQPTPTKTRLQKAIGGMENPAQHAIDVAKYDPDHHQSDSVSEVLESVSRSLERTPSPSSRMDPLLVSDSLDTSSDETPTEAEASLSPKTNHSSHTVALPIQSSAENANPVSPTHARKDATSRPRSLRSSSSTSIVLTPKQFYERKSADSIVTDWAYVKGRTPPARAQTPSPSSSSTSTSSPADVERQGSAHWRAWHNNTKRPLYPNNSQYVDGHVRSIHSPPTKDEVHDHIKRHGVPPTPPRGSSLRHRNANPPAHKHFQRFRSSDNPSETRNRRKERSNERSERYGGPRRRKLPQPQPWNDLNPRSFEGFGMGHPARTHVSFRGAEGLDIFKRQRREPIARNWGTAKKRITATIACINTALVGYLIGVYVRTRKGLASHLLIRDRPARCLESNMPLQIRDTSSSWEMCCE